jgi:hypothetical protein
MHPLENPRRVRFVWGYHPYVPPPDDAAANGLDGRFAVVLEAWPHYAPGSLVDTNLFFTLVRAVVETVPHDAVRIRLTDGSVRFVSENVNLMTWRALFTRAGGEPLGEF